MKGWTESRAQCQSLINRSVGNPAGPQDTMNCPKMPSQLFLILEPQARWGHWWEVESFLHGLGQDPPDTEAHFDLDVQLVRNFPVLLTTTPVDTDQPNSSETWWVPVCWAEGWISIISLRGGEFYFINSVTWAANMNPRYQCTQTISSLGDTNKPCSVGVGGNTDSPASWV